MKTLNLTCMAIVLIAASNSFGVVNGTFDNSGLGDGTVQFQDIDAGWFAKDAGNNWNIQGGELVHLATSGSNTRAGQVFTNTLSGTDFSLNFDVNDTNITRVQLFGGNITGANNPTTNVLGFGNDNFPTGNIDWGSDELVDASFSSPGPKSLPIAADLGNFDLLAVRFLRGATGASIDNVEIAPSTASNEIVIDAFRGLSFGNTSGGNPGNAGIFSSNGGTTPDPSVTGSATTTVTSPFTRSPNSEGVMSFHVVDPVIGSEFTFDVRVEGFRVDGSGNVIATQLRQTSNLSVDSPGNNDSRNDTEPLTAGGDREFQIISIENFQLVAGLMPEQFGFDTLTINGQGAGDLGLILDEATQSIVGIWDFDTNGVSTQAVPFGGFLFPSLVIQPTAGNGINLKGFQARATFGRGSGAGVPEPTTAMLGLIGMAGLAARRRRHADAA